MLPSLAHLQPDAPPPPPPLLPTHVDERDGPWDSVALDPAFFPALQTTLPMVAVYMKHPSDGWIQHVLIAESSLLRRAGAPPGLGMYALRRFRGPRELTTPRARRVEGEAVGSYGGKVVSHAPTQHEADAAANELVQQGAEYLLTLRIQGHAGWFVVDGAQQPVLPFLFRVNDPRGTPLLPRCTVSEYGVFRAARDIPALDWTRPLKEQAVSELSFAYGDDYWRVRRSVDVGCVSSLLEQLALNSAAVAADGQSSERRRSLRGDRALTTVPQQPNLVAIERDGNDRLVYASFEAARESETLVNLRRRLLDVRPTIAVLERLTPINRGRILVEIADAQVATLFRQWMLATLQDASLPLAQMLAPLGSRVLLLGAQFIVPRVTEYERSILPQTPHSDVDVKGEVISVAVHVNGGEMGTLIARADGSFGRANASVFAYDTGTIHYGPGTPNVPPPYPRYSTDRVFFLLCSASLDPNRISRHRRDNGLAGSTNLIVELLPP